MNTNTSTNYQIEKEWTTQVGLKAVVIISTMGHRCGYVGVPADHITFGKNYREQLDFISQEQVSSVEVGSKSPILVITARVDADNEDSIRRSLDILIDAHGGLTYSKGSSDYPIETEDGSTWWFGYDTGHYGDYPELGGQPLQYCIDNCEEIAEQLQALQKGETK